MQRQRTKVGRCSIKYLASLQSILAALLLLPARPNNVSAQALDITVFSTVD